LTWKSSQASARATQRQREGIDPPGFSPGQVEPEPTVLDRAAWWVVDLVKPRPGDFWAAFLGTIFALVVAKWFGLI